MSFQGLMKGKRGLIMGVANQHSIAWGIAQTLHEAGAELAFSYQGDLFKKRVVPLVEPLKPAALIDCDVSKPESIDAAFAELGKVWDSLDVVARRVIQNDTFHIAAPMEFRFVKAGTTALGGTYSQNPNAYFVNVDLIGFIEPTPSANYPATMLQFFADVERDWVAMDGYPHNGKMYGFYDPTMPAGTHTPAFNANFFADLRTRRGQRLTAFNNYRQARDPKGLFYNDFLRQLLEG